MSSRRIQHFVVVAMTLGAVAAPASAFGQTSQEAYNPPAGQIQDEVAQEGGGGGPGGGAPGGPGGGENASQPTGGGALPFTGMDLVLLLGGGGLLLSAGLGMRRLARGPDLA
jgi:hypothetical protein